MRSPLSKSEAEQRINASTGSAFWPFSNGVKGGVYFGFLRLSYTDMWFYHYNLKPVLAGKLIDNLGSSELEARYRAPIFAYLFFSFWYGLWTFMIVGIAASAVRGGLEPGGWIFFPVLALFFLAPLGMHYLFTRNSNDEFVDLTDHLCEVAGFEFTSLHG